MLDKWFAAARAAAWGGVFSGGCFRFVHRCAGEGGNPLPRSRDCPGGGLPLLRRERPGNLSLYAREDYHRVVTRRLNTVCDALRRKYPGNCVSPPPTTPLPEREAAWLAGIGLRGKTAC